MVIATHIPRPRIASTHHPLIVSLLLSVAACLASSPTASARGGVVLNEVDKLLASDGSTVDDLGRSVAIDGDTLVVGAPRNDDACPGNVNCDSGSAYVFVRDAAGVWTQQAKLLASDGMGADPFGEDDLFGWSVAISGDTAVVGAIGVNNGSVLDTGAAYVFVRDAAGVWTEQVKLFASDGTAGESLGWSVSLSGDTMIVGSVLDGDNGFGAGSAYVFVRDTGVWTEQTKLLASDGAQLDSFGRSISLDGDTAVIGALQDDDNGLNSGSAYIFVRDAANVWTEQPKLLASDGALGDAFGQSVALSGDTAVVGAYRDDDLGNDSGSAYVFVRDAGGIWTQQPKLLADDGFANGNFGFSISIHGNTIIVGALVSGFGSAYVFAPDAGGVWMQQSKLLASDGVLADGFGGAVAVNGGTVVAGAALDDDNGANSGSAYIFDLPQDCSADTDASGDVGIDDFLAVLAQWGPCPTPCSADTDASGDVGIDDFLAILADWGLCP